MEKLPTVAARPLQHGCALSCTRDTPTHLLQLYTSNPPRGVVNVVAGRSIPFPAAGTVLRHHHLSTLIVNLRQHSPWPPPSRYSLLHISLIALRWNASSLPHLATASSVTNPISSKSSAVKVRTALGYWTASCCTGPLIALSMAALELFFVFCS